MNHVTKNYHDYDNIQFSSQDIMFLCSLFWNMCPFWFSSISTLDIPLPFYRIRYSIFDRLKMAPCLLFNGCCRKCSAWGPRHLIRKLRISSHLLKKALMENFIFCAWDVLIKYVYHKTFISAKVDDCARNMRISLFLKRDPRICRWKVTNIHKNTSIDRDIVW